MFCLSCAHIFPGEFLFTTVFHVAYYVAVPACVAGHLAHRLAVLTPFNLPLRVVVPDIGNHAVRFHRVLSGAVGTELLVRTASDSLVAPAEGVSVGLVDVI